MPNSALISTPTPLRQPRPFIKWAGGKGQLLSQYESLFPSRWTRYFEPFLGGGAIFFHLQPARAVLADVNPALISLYRCVRDHAPEVLALLEVHQANHCLEHYYAVRSQHHLPAIAHAARFIYLNKTCFNGLYRENLKGEFNVPMGRYKKPMIWDPQRVLAASALLQNTELLLQDFSQIRERASRATDFVYLDPPYHPLSNTSNFTAYSKLAFGELQQRQLRRVFAQLAEAGVQVMLSNSDCEFIRELYRDFHIHTISASRSINVKGTHRGKINEVVVTSYPV